MGDQIKVDRWSYDGLRRFAERYLSDAHPSGTIPVPIEEIVDLKHQIDVVPMESLREWEVDAFTSRDRQTIYVDRGVYSHRSPNRLRFSLAHELSHILLTCSPELDPVAMRVSTACQAGKEAAHEADTSQSRTDHRQAA